MFLFVVACKCRHRLVLSVEDFWVLEMSVATLYSKTLVYERVYTQSKLSLALDRTHGLFIQMG